jgi:hypothetical protein
MNSSKDSSTYFTFECKCGSKQCRKIITEDDWKIKELQKKYNGHFQWFLQKKINIGMVKVNEKKSMASFRYTLSNKN